MTLKMKHLFTLAALLALTAFSASAQTGTVRPHKATAYAASGTLPATLASAATATVTNVTFYPSTAGNLIGFNYSTSATNASVFAFAFEVAADGTNYTTGTHVTVSVTNNTVDGSNYICTNLSTVQLGNAPLAKLKSITQTSGVTITNGPITITQYR